MVTYFNSMMYQKGQAGNLAYDTPAWYPASYSAAHHASNGQYFSARNSNVESDSGAMYPHHHHYMFQQGTDWSVHDGGYGTPQSSPLIASSLGPSVTQTTPHGGHHGQTNGGGVVDAQMDHMTEDGMTNIPPSPPITVNSGCSEMSSPGIGNNGGGMTVNDESHMTSRSSNAKSPYEWIKKSSYQSHPHPGKTRTKDKYRVVYTDYQRLELEKEYCTAQYITIRRKSELAQSLQLSERQVKIWFQNRRAKQRKQQKKTDPAVSSSMANAALAMPHMHGGGGLDIKPKLEPGLMPSHSQYGNHLHNIHHHHHSLSHTMHQMGSMASMGGMSSMGLHNPLGLHLHHPTTSLSASPLPSSMSMSSQSQHNLSAA